MTLDEHRDSWQAQAGPGLSAAAGEELLTWIRERSAELDRHILRRDLVEGVTAAAMVLLFGYELLTTESWLARLGAALLVAASVFVVWWMRRARRVGRSTGPEASVVDRLRAQREQVTAQIRLLESVLWWYLGPLGLGVALFVFGLEVAVWRSGLVVLAMMILYGLIWRLNQRAVHRDLVPRRDRLDRMLEQIENHENGRTG